MTQICPDCGEKFPDHYNYCMFCAAKLPNARVNFLDYKSGLKSLEEKSKIANEVEEAFKRKIMTPEFHEAFFINIIKRLEPKADSEYERYLSSKIMEVFRSTLDEEWH